MHVLIIAAHPDDEVLGCGGTIARLATEGHDVHVAILGEGVTSRYPHRSGADAGIVDSLHRCSQQVAQLLGAKDVTVGDLPDNRFDTVALLDIVKIIEGLVERLQPQVIYTHHGGDLNIDHCTVHRAVLTATRPTARCHVKEIYAFEVPSATEWAFGQFALAFRASVFVDVTETLSRKIEAIRVYDSEVREFPHPRSPQGLTALAQYRGSAVGFAAAEAFELIRRVV